MINNCIRNKTFKTIGSFIKGIFYLLYFLYLKKNGELYVLLTRAIGDDVYGLSYIHELKAKHNKRIIIYCLKSRKKLVENYGVADEIRSFEMGKDGWRSINYHKVLIDIARIFGIYSIFPDLYIPIEQNGRKSCLDIMKYDMLKVGDKVSVQFPDFSNEPITSIRDICGIGYKTIIINYSSKSMRQIDLSLFQKIADDLLAQGYILFTNVVGTQQPLKGTKPLDCSIYELFAICNKVKAVISVRSGILDICANTKANFLVYNFPFEGKSDKFNEGWCHRYNMKAWGKTNVMECFVDNCEDAIRAYNNFKTQFFN